MITLCPKLATNAMFYTHLFFQATACTKTLIVLPHAHIQGAVFANHTAMNGSVAQLYALVDVFNAQ